MTTTCTTPGCDREVYARGMCSTHYTRALRAGLPRVVHPSTCTVPGCLVSGLPAQLADASGLAES